MVGTITKETASVKFVKLVMILKEILIVGAKELPFQLFARKAPLPMQVYLAQMSSRFYNLFN